VSKGRLEAFSDGVFAIAITLLVLELPIPAAGGEESLAHQLKDEWPSFAAYVVSFATIGVIWINHHAMLRRVREIDHSTLVLNLLLLLWVGLLPWTTALLAEYLREGDGQHLAAAIYAGSYLLMSLTFFAMQRHILFAMDHALDPEARAARETIWRRNRAGLLPYAIATAVAPLSSYVTLAICAAIAVFYALPSTTSDDLNTG
jgi:uncharacterized membrane protein